MRTGCSSLPSPAIVRAYSLRHPVKQLAQNLHFGFRKDEILPRHLEFKALSEVTHPVHEVLVLPKCQAVRSSMPKISAKSR